MADIRLAILWHQHQPFYRDLLTGEYRMPWVRLHGTKDYWGMARLVEEAGGAVRVNVNLVPCLVDQIEDYARGDATDPHLELSRRPAEDLSALDREQALDLFFMAEFDRMIRVWPRYGELLAKRRPGRIPAKHAVPEFSTADLRDLQVWANLAWFHRILLAGDPLLAELVAKGRDFTEEEKGALLDRQREVVAEVLPLHRELVDRGWLGVSTSPYYHPILPLLADMDSARVALPGTRLPTERRPLPEDARAHLERAAARMEGLLGRRPAGLWPSEGSVSPEMLPLVRRAGFRWLASDEGVLAASRGREWRREDIYRPWRLDTPDGPLAMVFRDHALSDLVGFDYQRAPAGEAVRDFTGRLREIRRRCGGPALVPVILDGENPWEHYPEGGIPFLRGLYSALGSARDVETVLLDEEIEARPPAAALSRLHSGSWIHANFAIWIGHEEDVRAWEYLFRVREDLLRFREEAEREGGLDPAAARAFENALECLFAAEGSDWTWWYGEDHTSGHDELFDELYRTHLSNVYRFLGREPPAFLRTPVPLSRRPGSVLEPVSFLRVALDGRETDYFEWLAAGRYRLPAAAAPTSAGGAMSRAEAGLLVDLRFGFGPDVLYLRVDPREDFREALAERGRGRAGGEPRFVFRFSEPRTVALAVRGIDGDPVVEIDGRAAPAGAEAAFDEILEVAVPFAALGFAPGETVAFHVELSAGKRVFERCPGGETVRFAVPTDDFEAVRWRV